MFDSYVQGLLAWHRMAVQACCPELGAGPATTWLPQGPDSTVSQPCAEMGVCACPGAAGQCKLTSCSTHQDWGMHIFVSILHSPPWQRPRMG